MSKKVVCFTAILIITFCNIYDVAAQDLPGKLDTIYSNVLNEKRILRVVLPDDYKPGSDKKYDVLYVLDGGSNVKTVYEVERYLEDQETVSPTIIVSIGNVD